MNRRKLMVGMATVGLVPVAGGANTPKQYKAWDRVGLLIHDDGRETTVFMCPDGVCRARCYTKEVDESILLAYEKYLDTPRGEYIHGNIDSVSWDYDNKPYFPWEHT